MHSQMETNTNNGTQDKNKTMRDEHMKHWMQTKWFGRDTESSEETRGALTRSKEAASEDSVLIQTSCTLGHNAENILVSQFKYA